MKRFFITLVVFVLCCGPYRQITQQLPTFANMQAVAKRIQDVVERNGSISDEAALAIIMDINSGLDDWGNSLLYRSRRVPGFSFVLISPGKDGVLERKDLLEYFEVPSENIVGDLDRDIVFRDGKALTNASGK